MKNKKKKRKKASCNERDKSDTAVPVVDRWDELPTVKGGVTLDDPFILNRSASFSL